MKKLTLFLWYICSHVVTAQAASYGVARYPAPVLNTPAFNSVFGGADGKTLKTDRCGQVRELEFIALPGTVFNIHTKISDGNNSVYRVDTGDYPMPAKAALYVDSRFVEIREVKPQPRVPTLPPLTTIIAKLKSSVGVPYVWGGNIQDGVSKLIETFYGGVMPAVSNTHLTLAGLDCSGLLYQATGGWTPRNTSRLVSFGKSVSVAGKSFEEIEGNLAPLDLIVWNGHVIIVLDGEAVIESRLVCGKSGNGGVMIMPLRQRLKEILKTRRPVDSWPTAGKQRDIFVVRRWF